MNITIKGIQQREFLFQCLKDGTFNITDLKYLRCASGLPNQFQALSAPECRYNLFEIVRHHSSAISAADFSFQWKVHAAHYIISHDPRDNADHDLTGERAQAIGLEYAKANFPGHQALVCTHTDGNNGTGNIHTHIIINSLVPCTLDGQAEHLIEVVKPGMQFKRTVAADCRPKRTSGGAGRLTRCRLRFHLCAFSVDEALCFRLLSDGSLL